MMMTTGLRDVRLVSGARRTAGRFLSAKNPFFTCVISHTATAEIPGLTVAGANPEMIKYTSPADAEFLHYGHCKCIPVVPATPDGKPTPALITRAALRAAEVPFLVADAGAKVRPAVPAVSMGTTGRPGGNIAVEDALEEKDVETALAYGRALGRQLACASDLVVIGESIPGGTTTALAVLCALGIDARFKVSSSMPYNPHELKNRVVDAALKRAKPETPAQCVARFGDPMIPAATGIALGVAEAGGRAMLAGGTQMAAVLAVMKALAGVSPNRVCIGTTAYVAADSSADLAGLVKSIAPEVPVLACDLHLGESRKPGLRAFAQGFVKEGVGAGGASIAAMIKMRDKNMDGKKMMRLVEQEYESSIEGKALGGS